jgi:predicted ATPase
MKKETIKKEALYLKSFKLKVLYRDMQPFTAKFRPGLNVIVGENGSGKSSLLELLMGPNGATSEKNASNVEFKFLDTEKHNPRIKSNIEYEKNIGYMIHSRFKSHGQTMGPLIQASEDFKDILLFIDEPEAGLSLSNQKRSLQAFEKAVENNCQILLTTHSYVIIKSVPEVFSMDDKVWLSSKDYLKKILGE